MVIGDTTDGTPVAHPSGIPQDKIDNIMSGISNTGAVKMNNHRKKLRQKFDIIKKLGQGTYGKVQLGINKATGQEVAIKTIKKCKIEAEADLVRIRREVQIMSSVQHPNIIHIYEVFENFEKMVLVMEFAAGGELYDYLSDRKVLTEEEARRIFRQVSTAVYYCHKHKICHRDLKLENILLDENGNAKIADFGLSNVFDEQRLLATFCGSPLYASPEIVKGTPYHGPEVDCWSLGVLLYTLVYGSMPFDGSNFKRLVKQISQGDYHEPKKPSRASGLINDMLTVCPRKRATIEQICNHWWVNEGYKESCLDLAETLANQTPVRLDVLLSLTPAAITAEQMVVPSAEPATKSNDRVTRSLSVGSFREIANTEAERRILDMVAAGGEAALMPSPTRTITPVQSPVQPKRKLENTISTDHANVVAMKKKDRPEEEVYGTPTQASLKRIDIESMEEDVALTPLEEDAIRENLQIVEGMCDELLSDAGLPADEASPIVREKTLTKLDSVKETDEVPEEVSPTKVIKKFVNKHKTADLVAAINKISPESSEASTRKNSLPDESIGKFNTERRRSRIMETAEKFQNMGSAQSDKPKKFVIPGVSVGNFKKEFERKASLTSSPMVSSSERRALEKKAEEQASNRKSSFGEEGSVTPPTPSSTEKTISPKSVTPPQNSVTQIVSKMESSDSKSSLTSFSLEEARRSMENSIALLNQAKHESAHDVDQLCAKTENVSVSDLSTERERKLKNAREIIGNAILPGTGIRKPPPFGANGRSVSGSVVLPTSAEKRQSRLASSELPSSPSPSSTISPPGSVKTSRAEITLKSATLPRRKTTKAEIQLDIKPKIIEQQPMLFQTQVQYPVQDLRSAPIRESPYSPISTTLHQRATSLEPQAKEHVIPIQRPPMSYTRTSSNSTARSDSLSRQSTIDSEPETTTQSTSTITGTSQPIKKSPREFYIPIAVEGGGFITPRTDIEPSDSSSTRTGSSSTFSRISRPRRIGSLLSEQDFVAESPFQKIRNASVSRDGDEDQPILKMHRLRSTRPVKKASQENDSNSSGEEDDDDQLYSLSSDTLFKTLLMRVKELTNRLKDNNDLTTGFPNSRLLNNMRQTHSPFWNQDPFGRSQFTYSYKSETVEKKHVRLNPSASNAASGGTQWRHSFSRGLGPDMESMFSRTGATLPRGSKKTKTSDTPNVTDLNENEPLDLADLDLSQLRLNKKELETLSSITPGLPKCYQEQLLAKLPPTQARKLYRTLSMQSSSRPATNYAHKRSQSGGRELSEESRNERARSSIPTPNDSSNYDSSERSLTTRRSASKSRTDSVEPKSRSASVCRFSDDPSKSLCSSYSSDVSDKYRYYSPFLNKDKDSDSPSVSPYKKYDSASPRESGTSPTKEDYGRPPSGCFSPPPITPDGTLRRRSSQRRVSRFLRPDFFDESNEDSPYLREKRQRERETQSVLREIREKSREPSRDRLSHNVDLEAATIRRKDSYGTDGTAGSRHVRNKSLERFCDVSDHSKTPEPQRRRSLSRPRDVPKEVLEDSDLTNKILKELQFISASQKNTRTESSVEKTSSSLETKKEKLETKKVKKVTKPKEKSVESTDSTIEVAPKPTLVKKVKKVVKKTEGATLKDSSTSKSDLEKPKRESLLKRPKSYPSKEGSTKSNESPISPTKQTVPISPEESKIIRPKSYPNSKLTNPKDVRRSTRSGASIASVIEKFSEKPSVEVLRHVPSRSSVSEEKSTTTTKSSDTSSADSKQTTAKKVVKVVKKIKSKDESSKDASPINVPQTKEKSPEKKPGKGILYAIGQKFEKLRDSAKGKEKKLSNASSTNVEEVKDVQDNGRTSLLKKKKSKSSDEGAKSTKKKDDKTDDKSNTKSEKRSRIDAMIRTLRERSVPRTAPITESGLIKRAVSVEEMPGTFNKCGVNRVLGLFKKYEKDGHERKVLNTRSTSNIERQFHDYESPIMQPKIERPKSSGFPSKKISVTKKSQPNIILISRTEDPVTSEPKLQIVSKAAPEPKSTCPDCMQVQEVTKRYPDKEQTPTNNDNKDKRKGLMLDFSQLDKLNNVSANANRSKPVVNGNHIEKGYDDISSSCSNNNNSFVLSSSHEINRNHIMTPSSEKLANYSSDSRSYIDDCASTSTFLSPTEEPELCFDNWSVCSEDNFMLATPSPTVSRLSRTSQYSSPTQHGSDQPESVIDRIKRRSFYCRFNEKKPKRQSNIVGPAARDYYRESAAKLRSRPPERIASPDPESSINNSNDFYQPLKLSSAGSELKPPHFKSSIDYSGSSKPRKSLHDSLPPSSPSFLSKRYNTTTDNDVLLRPRTSNPYESNNLPSSYYSTYNPKRRSSYTLNGTIPTSSVANIDGYATVGRRALRPYADHRSISLLDSNLPSTANGVSSIGAFRRDYRTPTRDNIASISRSNIHYRSPSVPRSPTNI